MSDRRTRILDSAAALIVRQGFQQTSVDDVIREADLCGKSHFYHYFKSKEELGYAVVNRQFEQFAEYGLAMLRDPMLQPLERLEHFIDEIVSGCAERDCQGGCPFANLVIEMADLHEGFRTRLEAIFERWAAHLESLLWEARPQLNDDVDTARFARFIIASLEGALIMARVTRNIGVMEDMAEELKRYVAMHVRARAPDAGAKV
jgi:TetR/AcrR family transcriptional repressor of nem operon